jgi:signal transduction histidine kinase
MSNTLPISHLPDLLPEGILHASLRLDCTGRLLEPGAAWADGDVGRRLDALIPEFNALAAVIEALRSGELDVFVKEPILRRNGSADLRTYRLRLHSAPAGDQVTAGLVLAVEDITEVHSLREQLASLRHDVAMHRALVDMVAHDLNTPLTALQGYLELVSAEVYEAGNDSIYEYLRVMQSSVERILFTVGEMYDVISLEVGHLHLAARTVQTSELLRRVVRETQLIVDRRHQTLTIQVQDDLPPIRCDEMRIVQVIQNLVSNASKYSPPHSPITISAVRDPDRVNIRFTVSDRGPGIGATELPFVFDRAYRASGASHQVKGAGLGLYLARLLIEMHGGRIWCDSVVGQGSDFRFTLPIADDLREL